MVNDKLAFEKIRTDVAACVAQLLDVARPGLDPVGLMVIGCSSSEIAGGAIGQMSSPEIGEAVSRAVIDACQRLGIVPAFQCCEHLNRALVVSASTVMRFNLDRVTVVPVPKAGGSVAAAAYRMLEQPVVVERIQADAGLDIGGTMIGMHLRPVAVPVRLPIMKIGKANVIAARTRPRLIGGARAQYYEAE